MNHIAVNDGNTMGPLRGVRVIEIASLAPAPFGAMMLADLGAEVIRIDRRSPGDGLTPPTGPLDRGKRALALDLKSSDGIGTLKELVRSADVFIEGFRPGVTERLGIGPTDLEQVNPALIYARMTGWGQDGPLASRAGHDINYIAVAGALEPIGRAGERPLAPLNLLGDFAGGGMLMAFGILAALHERQTSGRGQVVDAAMVDGAGLLTAFLHGMHANGLWPGERGTNVLDGGASFYDTYETADGKYVAVGCVEPQFYAEMLTILGIDEESEDLPFQLDASGWPRVRERLAEAFRQRTRDVWAELFAESDACVSPVLTPWEAHAHPHARARHSFVEVDGTIQPASAPRFSRTPAAEPTPMDSDGATTAAVLREWGVPSALVERLMGDPVV